MLFKDIFQKIKDRNPSNASEFMLFNLFFVLIFHRLALQFFITKSIALPSKSVIGKFLNTDFLDGIANHV